VHTRHQVRSPTHKLRRLTVKMGDKMQERFGAFMDPQNDESAYGSAEEPLFGSRYTSHDLPKYEYVDLLEFELSRLRSLVGMP